MRNRPLAAGADELTVTNAPTLVNITVAQALHFVYRMVEAWTSLFEGTG